MIVRFIVGCAFVGFFKPMVNFEMQNGKGCPHPSPLLHQQRHGNKLETIVSEVVAVVGVSLELISTIMQIRSRGLWDLGNKDDGVCYGCNWKMVKSGRFCTRTRLLSLGLLARISLG